MDEAYRKTIDEVSTLLALAVRACQPDLPPALADAEVRKLALACGAEGLRKLWAGAVSQEVIRLRDEGWTVDERHEVTVMTVLGPTSVQSPRLRDRKRRRATCRPTHEFLGLSGKQRTAAIERVLVDFGAEEAFGPAAKRVREHYGFDVGRTTVLRVVEHHARQAEAYVADRLAKAGADYDVPVRERPGEAEMLVGLDGSMVRTGQLEPAESQEKTPVRGLPKRRRAEAWREVRVGLCRPLGEVEPTCVAAMASYPQIVGQLFQAAVSRGLSSRTQTVAVADGGNGLREEVQAQFLKSAFVLDQFHVTEHLGKAADAMGLAGDVKRAWVHRLLRIMSEGQVHQVLAELRTYVGRGSDEVLGLRNYLERFKDCVHYDAYRQRDWPIGSGETESAHRTIPQKRLKLPGAWWRPETINPMLALRILRHDGWWEDYWKSQRPCQVA